ncbi:MAG: aminoacyl-tRNA hydrolase [Rhodopirellula sp.]|nr:aminoacyl-tRNA hydrolase [Rhodopirellula sp.]
MNSREFCDLPVTLVVDSRIQIPLSEFQFTFSRSSGPGGQNVNKVNTKATLRWPVAASPALPDDVRERFVARYRKRITTEGDLVLTSQRFRDAGRNAGDCVEKLRQMLLETALPPKKRKRTRPSAGSVRRRLEDKRQQSQKKQLRQRPEP